MEDTDCVCPKHTTLTMTFLRHMPEMFIVIRERETKLAAEGDRTWIALVQATNDVPEYETRKNQYLLMGIELHSLPGMPIHMMKIKPLSEPSDDYDFSIAFYEGILPVITSYEFRAAAAEKAKRN